MVVSLLDRTRLAEPGASPTPGRGLRIVYVVSMFPCWSETFIVREIEALRQAGVDVHIVSLRRCTESFMQSNARTLLPRVIYPRGYWQNLGRALQAVSLHPRRTARDWAAIAQSLWHRPGEMLKSLVVWFRTMGLVPALRRLQADHIHAHWATYPSTAAMLLAEHLGTRFSFTAHAHDIFEHAQLLEKKLEHASFVATISEFNRQFLSQRFGATASARLEIVRCGIAPTAAVRRRLPGVGETVLLSVGRLDEIKGFPTLIRACAELKRRGVAFKCRIVGEGPLRGELETQIRKLSLDAEVELTGAMASEEVDRAMRRASLFVLASQPALSGNMDGIPVALMEAMAAGTPVISTRVSGIPELIENEETGLLVPPQDEAALADGIARMLQDHELRRHCVEHARQRVIREFNAEREASRLLELYRDATGTSHAQATTYRYG